MNEPIPWPRPPRVTERADLHMGDSGRSWIVQGCKFPHDAVAAVGVKPGDESASIEGWRCASLTAQPLDNLTFLVTAKYDFGVIPAGHVLCSSCQCLNFDYANFCRTCRNELRVPVENFAKYTNSGGPR